MNSLILTAFFAAFKESFIYKAFIRIFNAVSKSWCNSKIISFLKEDLVSGKERFAGFYKIVRLPFAILEFIGKKIGISLKKATNESFIMHICSAFLDNALALNTRFFGIFALSSLMTKEILSPNFSAIYLVAFAVIILVSLTNYNITEFFSESKTVQFCLSVVGFRDISWKIFDDENRNSVFAYLLAVVIGIVSGVASLKSVIFAVLPIVAFCGFLTVLKYPIVGIFGAAFAAPFVPTMLLAGLVLLTSFSFVVNAILIPDFKWKTDGVGTGLLAFLLIMLISSVFSFARNKSILVWGMYLIFAGFYFIIINAVNNKNQLNSLIKVFVIAGAFVSIYGVLQYVFGWNTSNAWIDEEMFEKATMRAYSTMENPNVLGEYLLLIVPLSAYLMLKAEFKHLEKYFWIGTFLVSCLCMILTQSRGCWIGLFLTAVIFITFYNGKLWGLLPIVLVILPFVLPQTIIDRFMSVGNLEDSSTSYRVFIWMGTIGMLKDFWIGGIGMGEGAFRSVYPFYSYNSIIAPHSHNLYLQLLVEGGIGALLIFLVTMLVFFKKTSNMYIKDRNGDGVLALAFSGGIAGFLLQSMFDYTFYNYRMMAMFFMVIAFSVALCNLNGGMSYEGN